MTDICFVSSELSPLAKVGGLADVSSALPTALSRDDNNLTVVIPYYRDLKVGPNDVESVESLSDISLEFGPRRLGFSGYRAKFPGFERDEGPVLILIKCDELFGRPGIYGDESDEFLRFLLLSRAAIEVCQRTGFTPDVFHSNDWQTALIPLLLKTIYAWDSLFDNTSTILTIHNIGHQGIFSNSILPFLNLNDHDHLVHQDDLQSGVINYLKMGLLYADAVTTVSPTYAKQIQSAEYGMGLQDLLQRRSSDLFGILNGIDDTEWNPKTDALIPHNYSAHDLTGKHRNKLELLGKMGVERNPDSPTIGIVSRLTGQKGFELLFESMSLLLESRDMRLIVLGSGEEKYVEFFAGLRRRFPNKVGFFHGFDNGLAHLVEAGSDMFLMPSHYEPCGLNQMYSQVYGTVPIVRKTGGLADTVDPFVASTGSGTGFVFEHFTTEGARWAINQALDTFEDPSSWNQIVQNGMARDFSWSSQAREYAALYHRLANRTHNT